MKRDYASADERRRGPPRLGPHASEELGGRVEPDQLVDELAQRVRIWALRDGFSAEEAEELIGMTYLEGAPWERWESIGAGYARSYRHAAGDLRADQAEQRALVPLDLTEPCQDPGGEPSSILERKDLVHRAWQVVWRLPVHERYHLTLLFGDGLSHAEAARELGITEEAARQRSCRILQRLRAEYGGEAP